MADYRIMMERWREWRLGEYDYCCDNCAQGEVCCSITEDIKDVSKAKKLSEKLKTIEGRFRKAMYNLDDRLNADPLNQKYSRPLKDAYKKNVTVFMREMLSIVKKVK